MKRALAIVAVCLVSLWVLEAGVRVLHDEAVRNDPPPACQLLGGSWSIWSGWTCG